MVNTTENELRRLCPDMTDEEYAALTEIGATTAPYDGFAFGDILNAYQVGYEAGKRSREE